MNASVVRTIRNRSGSSRLHRAIRHTLAWTICCGSIAGSGLLAFRTVEHHARRQFQAYFGRLGVPMIDVGAVSGAVRLASGAEVEQAFRTDRDDLDGIQLRTVTWHRSPAAAEYGWRLEAESSAGSPRRILRSGRIDSRRAADWGFLEISFPPLVDSSRLSLVLVVTGPADDPGDPLGVPLFVPATAHAQAVVRSGGDGATGCLQLMLLHAGDKR